MLNKRILFICLVLFLCLPFEILLCADTPAMLIKLGLDKFRKGEYEPALANFERAIKEAKNNPHIDDGLYLIAKTNIRLGRLKKAQSALDDLRIKYPQSLYLPYASLLQAEIYYMEKKDSETYILLLSLLNPDFHLELRNYIEAKLESLVVPLSIKELRELRNASDEPGRQFINRLIQKRNDKGKYIILIAEEDKTAELTLAGIKTAFNKTSPWLPLKNPPEFEVISLGNNLLHNYLKIRDLSYEPVKGIISLLTGEQSLTAVMAGSWIEAPFFIVRDDSPELWRIGENIWQLPPDKLILGKELADFTNLDLKVDRFATISALDDSRAPFTESFIQQTHKNSGKVLVQEWYYSQAEDLGKYFKNLRNYGFRAGFEDSIKTLFEKKALVFKFTDRYRIPKAQRLPLNSECYTIKNLSEDLLTTLWSDYCALEREKARLQNLEVDSSDIPLNAYKGFIFPLKAEEVDMFIPQFAFYNFQTQLFTLLSAFPQLKLEKKIPSTSEVYLVGWGRLTRSGELFNALLDYYYKFHNSAPYDEEVLGFDAGNFVLSFDDLCELNKNNLKFSGIFYNFDFPASTRCNQEVDFYRLEKEHFVYFNRSENR